MDYKELLREVKGRKFGVSGDKQHVFYSGFSKSKNTENWKTAREYCRNFKASTIDLTDDGQWLNRHIQEGNFTKFEKDALWGAASKRYVANAKGDIVCFIEGAEPKRQYRRIEERQLYNHAEVKSINAVNRDQIIGFRSSPNGDELCRHTIVERQPAIGYLSSSREDTEAPKAVENELSQPERSESGDVTHSVPSGEGSRTSDEIEGDNPQKDQENDQALAAKAEIEREGEQGDRSGQSQSVQRAREDASIQLGRSESGELTPPERSGAENPTGDEINADDHQDQEIEQALVAKAEIEREGKQGDRLGQSQSVQRAREDASIQPGRSEIEELAPPEQNHPQNPNGDEFEDADPQKDQEIDHALAPKADFEGDGERADRSGRSQTVKRTPENAPTQKDRSENGEVTPPEKGDPQSPTGHEINVDDPPQDQEGNQALEAKAEIERDGVRDQPGRSQTVKQTPENAPTQKDRSENGEVTPSEKSDAQNPISQEINAYDPQQVQEGDQALEAKAEIERDAGQRDQPGRSQTVEQTVENAPTQQDRSEDGEVTPPEQSDAQNPTSDEISADDPQQDQETEQALEAKAEIERNDSANSTQEVQPEAEPASPPPLGPSGPDDDR